MAIRVRSVSVVVLTCPRVSRRQVHWKFKSASTGFARCDAGDAWPNPEHIIDAQALW